MVAQRSNNFAALAQALGQSSSQIVRKTAFDLQAQIQANIRANDQIDTGFMVNSVYVVTSDNSTYGGGKNALPEVGKPPDKYTAYTAIAAYYAIYQNYGTRYLPARPFFEPALYAVMPTFNAACAAIEDKMREISGL